MQCGPGSHREAPDDDFLAASLLGNLNRSEQLLGFLFAAGGDFLAVLRGKAVIKHQDIEVQPMGEIGQIIHRNPGFFTVGSIPMAKDDGFDGILRRNIPPLHYSAPVGCGKSDVLVFEVDGQLWIRIKRCHLWIGQYPGDIPVQRDKTKNQEEQHGQQESYEDIFNADAPGSRRGNIVGNISRRRQGKVISAGVAHALPSQYWII
ncbi:hypothetical protein D3C81_1186230 [compost metagenome]